WSPGWGFPTACGDLPLPAWPRKWPHENLGSAGFAGRVCDPSSVGREHGFLFIGGSTQENRRLAGFPARCVVAFDRKNHQVLRILGCVFVKRQVLSAGMK